MDKAILLTRPNHDALTNYLFYWSESVKKKAAEKGFRVLDLQGKKANKKMFTSYTEEHRPVLVFLNGHGNEDTVAGFNDEPLVETNKNEQLLADKVVYARTCDAAKSLGKKCVRVGTRAFIGYSRKFYVGHLPTKATEPLKDEVAKLFLEPSNLVPISLLKGNTVEDAHRKSQTAMWHNLLFMYSTVASPAQQAAAQLLWLNRKYQVVIGDQAVTL